MVRCGHVGRTFGVECQEDATHSFTHNQRVDTFRCEAHVKERECHRCHTKFIYFRPVNICKKCYMDSVSPNRVSDWL